jgi:hypothetical protein
VPQLLSLPRTLAARSSCSVTRRIPRPAGTWSLASSPVSRDEALTLGRGHCVCPP